MKRLVSFMPFQLFCYAAETFISITVGIKHNFNNILKEYIEERAIQIANYIIENNAAVRQTAKKFGISKFKVYMVVTKWKGLCGLYSSGEQGIWRNCYRASKCLFKILDCEM